MKYQYSKNIDIDISKDEEFSNDFIFIDMTINQLLLISKSMNFLIENDIKCIFKKEREPKFSIENVIQVLVDNLSNTLWIIRDLLAKGADYQAKILFRTFIEMQDLLIANLGSYDFFNKYTKTYNNDDAFLDFSKNWFDNIRPKKLSSTINRVYNEILKNKNYRVILSSLKKSNYQWLSLYTHGHFNTLQISKVIFDKNGETSLNNKYCSPDFKIVFTLNKLILHSGMSIQIIFKLLNSQHKLKNFLSDDLIKENDKKNQIYTDILFKNLEYLLENEKR
ncbi:hypothetical protein [Tenacibaculum singaporense]|uniref:hypothetical protein n=1 Tax=Tenacibaculum singaporense TaxID=2358479 RepID=UPI000F67A761|nr:hypothetical protein [Tenacibaculum singaporense]RSC95247.1 hypothetical protein EI424_06275 [Tenacibaculum singaporense]